MMRFFKAVALIAALMFAAPSLGSAADKSPIFGSAKVSTMSATDNAKVVGKGYYANYYGYYGQLNAYYSYYYGNYARYSTVANSYNEYTSYYYAYYYANLASSDLYNAYYYSYYGY